jgi:hypothetical protein
MTEPQNAQEMTLEQWVERLPVCHSARKEYAALVAASRTVEQPEPERPVIEYLRKAEQHLHDYFLLARRSQQSSKVDAALSVISQAIREQVRNELAEK